MVVLVKLFAVLVLMVWLLHRRVNIGNAMFIGAAGLFLLISPTIPTATAAVYVTMTQLSTWEIMVAMYCVMCLEYQLRSSGVLDGFMAAMRSCLASDRALLGFMPAFMGFLPSLGGAIFSAPLVENASRRYEVSPDNKSTINFWFRHVWEYTNPIVPALLLAAEIAKVPLATLITHLSVFTVAGVVLGWLFCLSGLKPAAAPAAGTQCEQTGTYRYLLLAMGPVVINLLLVVAFHISPAVSMGLVVAALVPLLRQSGSDVLQMLKYALDRKLLWGIFSILFFQHMLEATGAIKDIVQIFFSSGLSTAFIIGGTAFAVGMMTGSSQGFVAIAFPVIAAISPGNVGLATVGFVAGLAGHMLSPAHLCLVLTVEYFKASFTKALQPVLIMEVILVIGAFLLQAYVY
jgi:integral membrane protein (TIGR00529 family)